MDKRFKPLTPAEALDARRTLAAELAADPALPIPAVVRRIRTALRLTIPEYAKLCGVSARTLQDIEREESSPTLATAEKLLRPMGMVVSAVPKRRQAER
jgi:DNA-binding transcriptional regulator YiaG